VELAYELSDSVDYMLFSEELFPAALFSYQGMESITNESGYHGKKSRDKRL
jgi:hypothetical protein